jgi:hypothetical protein
MVSLWVDDERVGSGLRTFVVLSVGPKHVHLFNASTLSEITIDKATFMKHARPHDAKTGAVKRILRRNASIYKRMGLRYGPNKVKAALAVLDDND